MPSPKPPYIYNQEINLIMIGIYKITNPQGKIYIGQSVNLEKRKFQYKNLNAGVKKQPKIFNSIKKYGWESHKWEIIEECEVEFLDEKELYWGLYYNVLGKNGLVLRLGKGKGKLSQKVKNHLSIKHTGMKKPWAGKNMKLTEEHKEKLKKAKKNTLNPIFQYDLKGNFIKEWQNPKRASVDLQINNGYLSTIIDNINLSLGGYRWTSQYYINLPPIKNNRKKIVNQYDLEGNFIKEWESAKSAADNLKIHVQSITACCRNEVKSSHNFKWKYL